MVIFAKTDSYNYLLIVLYRVLTCAVETEF